ncbi:hypothetical protein CSKR_101516, partial [Clonorchis sinensis]
VSHISKRGTGLVDSCVGFIRHTAVAANTTPKIRRTLHNSQCPHLDCKLREHDLTIRGCKVHGEGRTTLAKSCGNLHLFEDETDAICVFQIDKVFISGYLNTGVLKIFQRSSHYLIDHKWLEYRFTDQKVCGSNPTSASRLPSRLGQPGNIPTLVLLSGGMVGKHRKGATAERLSFLFLPMRNHLPRLPKSSVIKILAAGPLYGKYAVRTAAVGVYKLGVED